MVHAADPGRVGQHGPELVMANCRRFEVHWQGVFRKSVVRP